MTSKYEMFSGKLISPLIATTFFVVYAWGGGKNVVFVFARSSFKGGKCVAFIFGRSL